VAITGAAGEVVADVHLANADGAAERRIDALLIASALS
jgi:hypothetical protein